MSTARAEGRGEHQRRDGAADPQKGDLKPWQLREWCFPTVGADFVCAMEDVLDLYEQVYAPNGPSSALMRSRCSSWAKRVSPGRCLPAGRGATTTSTNARAQPTSSWRSNR